MKRSLVIIFIALSLATCKEVSFKESQPKGKKKLEKVPQKLWGKYLLTDDNDSITQDTLYITSTGYNAGHNPEDHASLGDSLVLKYYKGYYFLNINENPEWLLRVIKKKKNGDLTYMTMEKKGVGFFDYLRDLSSEIKIDSLQSDQKKLYQIDPSPKQLISLIKNGYFKKIELKKIK